MNEVFRLRIRCECFVTDCLIGQSRLRGGCPSSKESARNRINNSLKVCLASIKSTEYIYCFAILIQRERKALYQTNSQTDIASILIDKVVHRKSNAVPRSYSHVTLWWTFPLCDGVKNAIFVWNMLNNW